MINYRELKTLTEKESNFILVDILNLTPVTKINVIGEIVSLEVLVGDYLLELELIEQDGYIHVNCMEVLFKEAGIKRTYHLLNNRVVAIRKYLFSLGMCSLLKDNKYLVQYEIDELKNIANKNFDDYKHSGKSLLDFLVGLTYESGFVLLNTLSIRSTLHCISPDEVKELGIPYILKLNLCDGFIMSVEEIRSEERVRG